MKLTLKLRADVLELVEHVYHSEVNEVLRALATPTSRYFIRVNTARVGVEELLKKLQEKGVEAHSHSDIREAVYFHVKGPFALPSFEKEVRVDKEAAESVMQGADLYCPGVLSASSGIRRGDGVSVLEDYTGTHVASGIAVLGRRRMLSQRRGRAVEVTHPLFRAPKVREMPEYGEGLIYPQTLPSMLAVIALEPWRHHVILDMCAAPGGKLTYIVQLAPHARIIGVDRNKRKIAEIEHTIARLKLRRVELLVEDSRYLDLRYPVLKPDAILLDPPCSALGVRPKLYDRKTRRDIEALVSLQRQLLKVAAKILKPGGTLVYSVCTVTASECEENMKFAMELGLEPVEPPELVKKAGEACQGAVRFHPHVHDTPGFFIAVFTKHRKHFYCSEAGIS
ncbi:MAG: hypothetical protein DRN99_00600 [Thermoproteota archaeon]|nr:MAG: hypothetical protein DRN99_00600 [Candidatus Korarchaeota archaeon]